MNPQEAFIGFAVYGVISSFIGLFTFFIIKDAKCKQTLWTLQAVVFGIFFVGFIYWSGGDGPKLLVWIPLVILMSIYNIHSLKFCGSCGKTNVRKSGLSSIKSCSECGNAL
ncbi:Zinc ribbon protein [Vibrio crassostreae]|uniref:Zinc ribbon protein n=1 Tax=Vibrio crassostreae TaxID=246167 RepID=A0A4R2G922_9VIBR|nr:hypothetical protein [Vibrio crassostreae]MDH5950300.1 hypothetical protein [Vibrio crassostreae]ROP14560.1 hypothetical protein EDB33_1166 [Vibrio crassostreae]ROP16109.1 hypothetical protein EDB34_11685 [Vibrio crassostreae]ROS70534.1 hypothetical protein EDB73_101210 [Vibrio crassostreae]RPE90361.1 hypothetical protein EDB15_11685 [Vibrio crassostreae]